MDREIIVKTTPRETRVALLEQGTVSELFIERESSRGIAGNLYKGRVSRVLPGMQSAFVELGLERDAFLYVADVFEEWGENLLTPEEQALANDANHRAGRIEDRLHEGQEVVVQAIKEPLGTKGARITSHVSLPGRYLVFMPTVEHVGVSRKITDDGERRRLKALLKEIRLERGGGGLIARTAGEGREREAFERDARYLFKRWDEIRATASRERSPALLHHELGLVQRLLRDLLNGEVSQILLDDKTEFDRTLDLVNQLEPELAPRVRLYTQNQGIFEAFGVQAELERALHPKVWLASGGYLVINHTEALVAIDVNTGRYVGRKGLEETIVNTNIEAAREIVRQIRLRDLGGIIVVDFIDMEERKSRQSVLQELERELHSDRAPSKVLSIHEFGLVVITRKRVRQSLQQTLCQPCPYCTGAGFVKNAATVCGEMFDEISRLSADLPGRRLLVRVNPDVAHALSSDEAATLVALASRAEIEIKVAADPLLHHEQFDVVPL